MALAGERRQPAGDGRDIAERSPSTLRRSPAALTLDIAKKGLPADAVELPFHSVHSITVPGSAAGWVDTVEQFGSGKLSLREILQPAIDLAEEGWAILQRKACQAATHGVCPRSRFPVACICADLVSSYWHGVC